MAARINRTQRYQKGLTLNQLFPPTSGKCACGCGKQLRDSKKRWATDKCLDKALVYFFIIKGHTSTIRQELLKRDKGKCAKCQKKVDKWEADHIVPVFMGGGGCDLTNYQTLCPDCHKTKTEQQKQFLKRK